MKHYAENIFDFDEIILQKIKLRDYNIMIFEDAIFDTDYL